jgi:transposase
MRKIIFYVVLTACAFIRIYFNYSKINYVYIRDSFVKSKNDGVFVRIYFANHKKNASFADWQKRQ